MRIKNRSFLLILTVALGIASCSDHSGIAGKWNFEHVLFIEVAGDSLSQVMQGKMEQAMAGTSFEFRDDSTCLRRSIQREEKGIYSIDKSGKILTTKVNDRMKEFVLVSVSDSLLDLSSPNAKNIVVRFRREN